MALSVYAFLGVIEESIIEQTMQYEMSQYRSRPEAHRTEGTETVTIWSSPSDNLAAIPDYLRGLEPGTHRVTHRNRRYRILVQDSEGRRRFLRFDVTQIVQRDRQVLAALAKSILLAVGVSIVAGWLLARRVIRPLQRLGSDLRALEVGSASESTLGGYADDEVGALAERFRDYHKRFEEMLQREHEFASNVSHELRTPVTSINMAVEVLANDPSISKRQGERLQRIQRAGREMSELVRTFMLLARAEEGNEEETARCDVNETVRSVLDDQQVWLGGKPVSVSFEETSQLVIQAPPGVVAVLIANVVRNAFRYTQKGWVRVSITNTSVIVEDSGPGIDSALTGRLFDRNVHGPHGSGLGLSIVKRICERYDWTVSVETTHGTGTRFAIVFVADGNATEPGNPDFTQDTCL